MTNKRLFFQSFLSVIITVFIVAGIVSATTIGANIDTSGTLTVSGNATFDSTTLYVDAANNRVGIGTTTPDTLLNVDGSGTFGQLCIGLSCISDWSSVGPFDGSGGAGRLAVWTDADTLSASATLQVAYGGTGLASAPSYGQMLIGNASGGFEYIASSSLGANAFSGGSGTVNAGIGGQIAYYPSSDTSIQGTSTITIANSGYVGIGTTTPIHRFTVDGGLDVFGDLYVSGSNRSDYFIDSAGTWGQLWSSDGVGQGAWMATSGLGLLGQEIVSSLNSDSIPYWNGSALVNSGISYLAGNIGIGTVSPEKKLHVAGETKLAGDVTLEDGEAISNLNDTVALSRSALLLTPVTATTSDNSDYTVSDLYIDSYATGTLFMVTFEESNTGGGAWLSIGGLASVRIVRVDRGGISINEIDQGSTHLLMYDPKGNGGFQAAFVDISFGL